MPTTYEYKCNNAGELEAIEGFLKKRGWRRYCSHIPLMQFLGDYPFAQFETEDKMINGSRCQSLDLAPITLQEIFAGKLEAPKCVEVKLRPGEFNIAKVTAQGITIPGYATLPLSIVADLAAAVKEVTGE